MQQIEITKGSHYVIATRNGEGSPWSARLYVNQGTSATLASRKFKTEKGVRDWASKVL